MKLRGAEGWREVEAELVWERASSPVPWEPGYSGEEGRWCAVGLYRSAAAWLLWVRWYSNRPEDRDEYLLLEFPCLEEACRWLRVHLPAGLLGEAPGC